MTTEKPVKCWICEREYSGVNCPECGPPEPWGPTGEEIPREEDKGFRMLLGQS